MSNRLLCSSGTKRKACDAGLGKEENQGEATDCERAITIALKHDVFCIADLAQLSLINKNLKGEIRQDHVWKPFLHTNRLGFGSALVIDDSNWPDKNIPPLENHTLMIPPRIPGPIQDDRIPEPIQEDRVIDSLFSRFNQETGAIEDHLITYLYDPVIEMSGLETAYLPRALPVQCSICCSNDSFETYPAFVNHLKSSGHVRKMTRKRYERDEIPEEWYDPRLYDDFDTMTNFEQVRALFEFKAKVLRKLREPMSDFVIQRMDHMLERLCIANNTQHILDSTDARDRALKRLIRGATDLAEKNFAHHGVGKHYCLSFLQEEWGSFFKLAQRDDSGRMGRLIIEAIQD
jgi:hypothetical protein